MRRAALAQAMRDEPSQPDAWTLYPSHSARRGSHTLRHRPAPTAAPTPPPTTGPRALTLRSILGVLLLNARCAARPVRRRVRRRRGGGGGVAAVAAWRACALCVCARSAIWLEASEGQWEAAATLAHVAVAAHYGDASLWQAWLELEEMRGRPEPLLRLRALASASGVRLK